MGLRDIASGLIGGSSDDEVVDGEPDDLDADLDGGDEFGDLGGWDDEEDDMDDFGEADGDGAPDLEPRLDELEKEMESISSTMGTVRSENEAINETVEEIEDNIRKLLEIYEMVTRGVNPFVDDAEGAAGMGDSFGLFDAGEGGGTDEDIDADLAEADADSFFDDEWDGDEFVDDEAVDDPVVDDDGEDVHEVTDDDEAGKTFDELKSEYEGDVDWTENGGEEIDDPSTVGSVDAGGDDGVPEPPGVVDEGASVTDDTPDAPVDDAKAASGDGRAADGGKPYLRELPTGYGADLLVIEWLSFLRSCSSTPETFRAIRYYETIGWIGEEAADALTQYLTGLGDDEEGPHGDHSTQLTVDHHTRSLGFIGQLGGADVRIERLDWSGTPGQGVQHEGGEQRGIQR